MRQSLTTTATKRSSASHKGAGPDVGRISYPCPADPEASGPGFLHMGHWLATASCMDLRQQSKNDHYREQLHRHNNSSHLPHSEAKQVKPASYTKRVPRSEWTHVPLPYRPTAWQDVKDEALPVTREPRRWRLWPSMSEGTRKTTESRGHRRPGLCRSVAARDCQQQQRPDSDPALLYPQMSPYDDAASSYSAPDELDPVPRTVSQPNTTSSYRETSPCASETEDRPALTVISKIPACPPAGRRRPRTAANIVETTFTDEEEFRLFVQATAGLGPEQAFRGLSSPESPRRSRTTAGRLFSPVSNDLVSPLQETPTTVYARQQLAQMPRGPQLPPQVRLDARQPFEARTLDTALDGLDLWLQPPSAVSEEDDGFVSPIDDDDDDELPDYAASQAQAEAAQRSKATQRAQELQRRWHLRTG